IRHVELAKIVDVHPVTLQHYMNKHGIERCYSNLCDCELDALVKIFKCHRPEKYKVKCSNALWHLDGHHKMIWWGIVIHGFIDSYCRTVVALRTSTNNCATTVLNLFLEAQEEYG
ncbi:hypothetical protein BDR03DRAFT_801206, partial [Suillus americanus]